MLFSSRIHIYFSDSKASFQLPKWQDKENGKKKKKKMGEGVGREEWEISNKKQFNLNTLLY